MVATEVFWHYVKNYKKKQDFPLTVIVQSETVGPLDVVTDQSLSVAAVVTGRLDLWTGTPVCPVHVPGEGRERRERRERGDGRLCEMCSL